MEIMSPSAFSQRAARSQGQPISELMHAALARPELISLAAGFVDNPSLPVEPTRQALEFLLSKPNQAQSALQYGTNAGYLPLRDRVLADQQRSDGHPAAMRDVTVDQVVITAGSNELLHLLVDTLCDPGDIILCPAPCYFVFLGIAANLGVRTIGVATDDDGLAPEALDEQLAELDAAGELPRVKAVYITPYFDNPSSVTLSEPRRAPIVELVKRWSARQQIYILEDCAYRELRYEGADIPSLRAYDDDGQTVVVTHTFSKSYSPGIRVGYGILPTSLVTPLLAQKGNINFGSSNFCQHLISTVLELDLLAPHVAQLRAVYTHKRDAMLAALDRHLAGVPGCRWQRPRGGLYVWLELPPHIDTDLHGDLCQQAMQQGVLYVPGKYCYPTAGHAPANNRIRLSFGVQPPDRIEQGIAALAAAVRAQLDSAKTASHRRPK